MEEFAYKVSGELLVTRLMCEKTVHFTDSKIVPNADSANHVNVLDNASPSAIESPGLRGSVAGTPDIAEHKPKQLSNFSTKP